MLKNRERIIAIVASVLAIVIVCLTFVYASTPRLPEWEKEKIEAIYAKKYSSPPLVWYDENGYVEEPGVWRYIGTYGECYAFLVIGDNIKDVRIPEDSMYVSLPYPVASSVLPRTVYYPTEVVVVLYHTQREFKGDQVMMGYGPSDVIMRMYMLDAISNLDEWISDWQLERLTRDIEKIAKAHN